MDAWRFDALTKALAQAMARRGAVKLLAGTVVAGVAVRATLRGAAACTDVEGEPCDPQYGCCEDAGLACEESSGTCVVAGDSQCTNVNEQTNQCVNAPRCEGKGCGRKKKKRKKGNKH
jgi:hypothetical protein